MSPISRTKPVDILTASFVMELMHSATRVHVAHLSVTGPGAYAAHKALNTFYDEVVEHADSIAEQYQGITEKILPYPDMVDIPVLKTTEQVIVYLRTLYEKANQLQAVMPYSEIVNQIDELKSLIDSTKYKLTFLK